METRHRIVLIGALAGAAGAGATIPLALRGGILGWVVGLLVAELLGAGAAWLAAAWLGRKVAEGLKELVQSRDAEGRPVTHHLGWRGLDEPVAALRDALMAAERTADALRREARAQAQEAGVLIASADRMDAGARDQAEMVDRTTGTVEALSAKIDQISQNAEDAAEAGARMRQEARRGLERIREIIDGMDRLRERVDANGRKARRLGDRSEEIGSIVELINGISSRTDMLALNATIESVRAGEHGRGFSVVAEEIRKLAERTAAATREIGTLVEAIQADAHESIRALAEEQADMENEANRVREAGGALDRIGEFADRSAGLAEGISRSANDQVLATQDLVQAVQKMAEASQVIRAETSRFRDRAERLTPRGESEGRGSRLALTESRRRRLEAGTGR
jgi:methyl-accepting chemotaxis protein